MRALALPRPSRSRCRLAAAGLDRDLATAQEHVVAQKYDDVEPAYETAEKYYDYASHIPGVGGAPANDIRAKHATLHYWQKDYAAVMPQQTDPVGAVAADNTDLQLVVANAVYRTAQSKMKDKDVDDCRARSGHRRVHHRAQERAWNEDAAYNFEYWSGCATRSTRASASPAPAGDGAERT